MKVLLIDVDSHRGFPNLALMKISAWHKRRGDHVYFRKMCNPDLVYISCIYSWNRPKALGIAKMFPEAQIILGGSGINYESLPDEIEHTMPDYSLYGIDYSMGFTSRGCIRRCPWCIVPEKEGWIRDHAPISEFLHPDHEKLILLDNNFLASPKWRENLEFLIDHKLKVSFNQGLDIRLINEENAALLADCWYYDGDFNERRLYFSFDTLDVEPAVRRGVKILTNAGIPSDHLMCYMLCGYGVEPQDYTWDYFYRHDYYRLKVLRDELNVDPFVMKYNNRQDIKLLNHFTRYGSRPRIYKSIDFEDYDHGDSQKVISRLISLEQP